MILKSSKWVEEFLESFGETLKNNASAEKVAKNIKDVRVADIEVDEPNDEEEDLVIDEPVEEDIDAEINVNDLPVVMWNEEEYRVLFKDDGTAEILNDFGNHISTLKARTVDEVSQQLGDQEIVTTSKVDNLLTKIANFKKLADEIQEELINVKQQYARNDGFDEQEPDIRMTEYQDMLNSISLTEQQIMQDNSIDSTTRGQKYYAERVQLNADDTVKFQEMICPCCDSTNLEVLDNSSKVWTVKCTDCGATYEVDSETGEVFCQCDTTEEVPEETTMIEPTEIEETTEEIPPEDNGEVLEDTTEDNSYDDDEVFDLEEIDFDDIDLGLDEEDKEDEKKEDEENDNE